MLLKKQRSNELNVASSLIRMEASPPIMLAGLLPTKSITESLIQLCNEMVVMDKLPFVQKRNTTCMVRTIKLLSSLFEEIHETSNPLPPASILCLSELLSTIRRVKLLIQECLDGSVLWNLTQNERLDWEFHSQMKEMGKALDILPLSLLDLSADVREQVELIHKQAKRAQCCVDEQDFKRKDEMVQMVANSKRNKSAMDCKRAKEFMVALGLRRPSDYNEEIRLLEEEIQKQAGTGGLLVVHNISSLISFVKYVKCITYNILDGSDIEPVVEKVEQQKHNRSLSSLPTNISIPDEFRCPISLDLMRDPVIISSGHTYDRNSIAQWINAGHHSCPKTGQKLIHMALIPNYSLKTLIHKWCHENKVLFIDPSCSSSSSDPGFNKRKIWRSDDHKAIDHISATKTAVDAVRMTADFLVGKLATGSPDIQRQAAFELRLLAKTGMDNRRIIAEAGAIPFLTTLLDAHDARTQANAVTALLNLSIQENNKLLIMGASAMDRIVKVLKDGQSMEARENAAATIFSMSMVDEYKIAIGSHPRAIPGLITLLREGTTSGKRDAATALFSLSLYNANKVKAVQCGCIQLLAELLTDAKAGITDDALAVLALLSGSEEGLKEMRETRTLVPTLIDLLRYGSPKGKENSVTILLGMCRNGGEEVGRRLLTNPRSIPSLQCLASGGLSMKEPLEVDMARSKRSNRHGRSHPPRNGFKVFVDENMDEGADRSVTVNGGQMTRRDKGREEPGPLEIFVDDEEERDQIQTTQSGSTILGEPSVENACHHGWVDPTINMKEAMDDINGMLGNPIDFVKKKKQHKIAALCSSDVHCLEQELNERTIYTKEAMDDINEMFGRLLDF